MFTCRASEEANRYVRFKYRSHTNRVTIHTHAYTATLHPTLCQCSVLRYPGMNLFFGHTENNEGMSKVTTHVDTKI